MFDISLRREPDETVLEIVGAIDDPADVERLSEIFALVPDSKHLVLSLSGVRTLSEGAARTLRHKLERHATTAFVVVSASDVISMDLVLHDIDRLCPIVPTIEDAQEILNSHRARTRPSSAPTARTDPPAHRALRS